MAARDWAAPRIVGSDGGITALEAIDLEGRDIDEDWLQRLLHESPGVLPLDEIDGARGPLISLGREIAVKAGHIDNLFVSPNGDLTVVEAKLWRNPEARRKVVAQILDYAVALRGMTYSELDKVVIEADEARQGIWSRVVTRSADGASEAAFVTALERNLACGRFALVIAGDGIRTELEDLADLLDAHPDLGFRLALIELRPYVLTVGGDQSRDGVLVVPRVVGYTSEHTRAVIEVRNRVRSDVEVNVVAPTSANEATGNPKRTRLNEGLLLSRIAANVSQAEADATRELLAWWESEPGRRLQWYDNSVALQKRYRSADDQSSNAPILLLSDKGEGRGYPLDLARDGLSTSRELVDAAYASLGFSGKADWPSGSLRLAEPDRSESVRLTLAQLSGEIPSEL